jgi:hypothetical protein
VAKRSDDTAFLLRAGTDSVWRWPVAESGVALRFPPQSKTAAALKTALPGKPPHDSPNVGSHISNRLLFRPDSLILFAFL